MTRKLWPVWLAALLIIFLPEKNLWMGDGYTVRALFTNSLSQIVAFPDGAFFISPFPVFAGGMIGWGALSYLSGMVYLAGVAYLSIRHGAKYSILALLIIVQQFAGYYEIYGPVYAVSLWALIAYHEKRTEMSIVLALCAMFCHCVIGAPVVVLVALGRWAHKERLIAAMLLAILAWYTLFMVVFSTRTGSFFTLDGPYSLFSGYHILELLALFTVSYGWMAFSPAPKLTDRPLVLASLLALGMTCVFVPQLGMLRDWDLFSMATLLVSFAWITGVKALRPGSYATALGFLLVFMLFNSRPQLDFMARYLASHPEYKYNLASGHYKQVAQYIFVKEEGRVDLARLLDGGK